MRLSIGTKLIFVIFIVSALIISSIIGVAYWTFKSSLESQISDRITNNAFHIMDKWDRFMFERLSDIELLTNGKNPIMTFERGEIGNITDYLREFEKEKKIYSSVSVYDANGIKIGDTRGLDINNNASDYPFFREAVKGNIYYDSRPIFEKSLGIPVIHFSGPLRSANGNINGVIVTSFSINQISDILNIRYQKF